MHTQLVQFIKERVINSQLIIEAKVISKVAFWNNSQSTIYTDNKMEVFKVFKGNTLKDTISVITKGGIMEDHFLILSHHPDFSVGMEGIFFLTENDFEKLPNKYSTKHKIYRGEGSFIRYYDDGINPPAADKKKTYKNIVSEIYPDLRRFSKQKTIVLQSNTFETKMKNWLNKSSLKVGLKNPLTTSSPYPNTPDSPDTDEVAIEFEFDNVTINDSGDVNFDIMAKASEANILLGEAVVLLAYNPVVFGENAVDNNVVEVTKGTIIQDSEYTLQTNDFDAQTIEIEAIGECKKTANLYMLAVEFEQFSHVKIHISDWSAFENLSFDEFGMNGNMKYYDDQLNDCVDFDKVIVSNPISTFSSPTANISIEYNLRNAEITNSGGDDFLEFDITGKAEDAGTLFSFGEIFMNFNTDAFGFNVTDNNNLQVFKSPIINNSNYSAFYLDETGGTSFGIDIVSVNTDNLIVLPTTETELVHVRLKVQNCNSPANLNFDEISMFNGSTYFAGDGSPIPHETYFPLIAEDAINVALCPPNTPVILNFYPKTITAGTKSVLTIEGANFGNSLGEVMFQNADDGGATMMKALPPDFKINPLTTITHWTDSKIELYVPSNEGSTTDPAGSGNFVVKTSAGTPVTSPSPLDIPYAVGNFRNTFDEAIRFEMIDDNGIGGYTFHRSTNMNANAVDIDKTIKWGMNEWNCATGVTWNLDPIPSANTNQSATDGINLIYFAPDNQFSGGVIAFNSASGNRTQSCQNGAGERVEWFVDVDIAIKQTETWNFALGTNPGMNTSDFPSAILHEFGHAARLKHAIPREKVMYWMIEKNPPNNPSDAFQIHRILHQTDIEGGVNVLLSSQARINGTMCNGVKANLIHKNCITRVHDLQNDISFINVFPNPSLNLFNLELKLENNLDLKIEVFDLLGRSVLKRDFGRVSSGYHVLDIFPSNDLPSGTYLLKVVGDNNIANFKIIKL